MFGGRGFHDTGATRLCEGPGLGAKPVKTAESTGRSMAAGQLASTLWDQLPGDRASAQAPGQEAWGKGLGAVLRSRDGLSPCPAELAESS